ncbi:dolichyl-phosphate beta-glucosyltransferase [Embleya sp. NPDC008237]|uniref:dolichyl-phosphate beta-glucosyltransferase n=1 Tax=Embleya sp. NPDC008237 TaxID=3363978 RepID=UPI0036E3B165
MKRTPAGTELSVVIPVFNESRRLPATLTAVLDHLRGAGIDWELIVSDDGSTDDTYAVATAAAGHDPRVRVVRHPVNRGKGHAVRLGVAGSRGRRVLVCDADLATPIAELDRLQAALDDGFDAAIGSRGGPFTVDRPPVRRMLSDVGGRLIRAVALPGTVDTQCGFKLFDGAKARAAFARACVDGWAFDIEVLRLFLASGWSFVEVPVAWTHQSGSKLRPGHCLEVLTDLARVRLRHGRPQRPGTRSARPDGGSDTSRDPFAIPLPPGRAA